MLYKISMKKWIIPFGERSDAWQDSEKGEEFQEKMDAIETAIDDLEMIKDDLKTAFDLLD